MKKLLEKLANKTRSYNTPVTLVQDGLAMTPTDMIQSCNNGIPIATQTLPDSMFFDGEQSRLTDVPFELRRGVDIGDIQSYQDSCNEKVHSAYKNAKSQSKTTQTNKSSQTN